MTAWGCFSIADGLRLWPGCWDCDSVGGDVVYTKYGVMMLLVLVMTIVCVYYSPINYVKLQKSIF